MPHTVGRAIVDSLEAHDIDLVYCVPGESYLGFTNAMADNNRMRLIVCRHKNQPVVVHVHSSLEQISAWRRRS